MLYLLHHPEKHAPRHQNHCSMSNGYRDMVIFSICSHDGGHFGFLDINVDLTLSNDALFVSSSSKTYLQTPKSLLYVSWLQRYGHFQYLEAIMAAILNSRSCPEQIFGQLGLKCFIHLMVHKSVKKHQGTHNVWVPPLGYSTTLSFWANKISFYTWCQKTSILTNFETEFVLETKFNGQSMHFYIRKNAFAMLVGVLQHFFIYG